MIIFSVFIRGRKISSQIQQPIVTSSSYPQHIKKKHGKRNLLIISLFIVGFLLIGFLLVSFSKDTSTKNNGINQGTEQDSSTTEPLEPKILTEEQAIEAIESQYYYFPITIANTSAKEYDNYWSVTVKIPGDFIFEKLVDKYTGKITKIIQLPGIYSIGIDNEIGAKEIFLYVVRNNEISIDDINVVDNGYSWICSHDQYIVSINKGTGQYSEGGS